MQDRFPVHARVEDVCPLSFLYLVFALIDKTNKKSAPSSDATREVQHPMGLGNRVIPPTSVHASSHERADQT